MLDQGMPQVESQLRQLPDEQLVPLLRGQNTAVPPFLVMAEMQRRKQARMAAPPTPTATMAQELTDQGGIAKFADGGYVPPETTIARIQREARESGRFQPVDFGGMGDVTYPSDGMPGMSFEDMSMGNAYSAPRAAPTSAEKDAGIAAFMEKNRNNPVPGQKVPLAPGIPMDGQSASARMSAGIGGGRGAGQVPLTKVEDLAYYRKMLGDTPKEREITDAERDAAAESYSKRYGYDFSDEKAAQAERRAGIAGMRSESNNQALLKFGLNLMASKQRNGLRAIGESALPAVDFLAQARAAERKEMAAIQAGDMDIARAANREKVQALAYAQGMLKDNRSVQHSNALAEMNTGRQALSLRQQDIAQRRADQQENARERGLNMRAALAARSAAAGANGNFQIPGYVNDSIKEAIKSGREKLDDQTKALQMAKGTLTRQELALLNQLNDPQQRAMLDQQVVQSATRMFGIGNLPGGLYDRKTGKSANPGGLNEPTYLGGE